jgi:hypothetical protein
LGIVGKPERAWSDDLKLTQAHQADDEMVLRSPAERIQVYGWLWTASYKTKEPGPSDEALEIQDPSDSRINVARVTKL